MISKEDSEFKKLTPCEFCMLPVYPSSSEMRGRNQIIKAGAIIIRIDKRTGQERKRSVVCYDCQNDILSRTKTGNLLSLSLNIFLKGAAPTFGD
jgi:hypothetical protein